jgi:ferrous iron transport protein A
MRRKHGQKRCRNGGRHALKHAFSPITSPSVLPKTLYDLGLGDVARIVRIQGGTSLSLRRRLLDMGITKGAVLRVERHAPLGDPVQIFVKGYRLAVRLSEARNIEVEEVPCPEDTESSS